MMADDQQTTTTTARVYSAEVFGADMARALDAFAALEVCITADTLRCGGAVATAESVPFARPSGVSMYEADALTWRLYHTHASCVVNAINNAAYGDELARALHAHLFASFAEPNVVHPMVAVSVDQVRAALLAVRRVLRAMCDKKEAK
jgi:hypothetical protein